MKSFIFSLILTLGFAVCYAAPPPIFEHAHQIETPVPDISDMPVMFATIEMVSELQPAPLLIGNQTGFDSYACLITNDYSDVDIGRDTEDILLSSQSNLYNTNAIGGYLPLLTHSSGGMPY